MKYFHDFIHFITGQGLQLSVAEGGGADTGQAAAGTVAAGAGGTSTGTASVAQAVTTGAQASPILGSDGNFMPGWSKQLGGTEALETKFTSPKALVGSYVALEKLISAKGIIPPGPNATAEEKGAFYKALGRPDKPEDYGIKMPEKIGDKPFPKELWNDGQATAFAKWAHEKGWSKQQVQDAIDFDAQRTMGGHEANGAAQQKAKEANENALKAEWGTKYGENLALAKKAAEQAGGADLLAHPLANDPVFIKAMAKVGAMITETPAAGARGTQAGIQGDPSSQIAAIMNDKQHAWQPDFAKHGHSAAAHQAAVQQMQRLYQQKTGEAA